MGLVASESLPKIVILASGRGSNFSAIAEAVQKKTLEANIVLVASDRKAALVLEKAQALSLPTLFEKDQKKLLEVLLGLKIDFVVLAGFMRILSNEFIAAFRDPRGFSRIVNIHPSLLPAFPGLNSYQQAFDHGAKVTGASVHFVDSGVDTGPICAQQAFSIAHCQSAKEVEELGLKIEHVLYPQTLNWILKNNFEISQRGGRLHVQPH
jgi:phosphoribosylglycinamide formyltransferase-1